MLKTLVSIVGIALMVTGSVAASPLPGPDFVRKVERLMHWIADHSNLEVPDRQPAFLFVSVETINYVATGSRYKGDTTLEAAFSPTDAGIVFLPSSGYTDDVLLHELVHFMQLTNGRLASCMGDLEQEAYRLEEAFTAETGIGDPIAPISRILATVCPLPWQSH